MTVIAAVFSLALFVLTILVASYSNPRPHVLAVDSMALLAFTYLGIYLHESGHVISAKLSGFRVNRVIIGGGKVLLRSTMLGIPLTIGKGFVGLTVIGHIVGRLVRWRFAFFAAGGLLLQSLLAGACILVFKGQITAHVLEGGVNLPAMFVMANVLLIVNNVLPRRIRVSGEALPNDGLRLLTAPFLREHDFDEFRRADQLFMISDLLDKREYRGVVDACEEYIEKTSDWAGVCLTMCYALVSLLDLQKAERILLKLPPEAEGQDISFAIRAHLALINLLRYTNESKRKADEFSRMAFESNSNLDIIVGIRGWVLIAVGRFEEGMSLLAQITRSKKPIGAQTNYVESFMFLAYAHFVTNEPGLGSHYWERAQSYAPRMNPAERHLFEIIGRQIDALDRAA